jgi:hypothetical protein
VKRGKLRPVIPRHVAACQHSVIEHERWFIWTWKKSDPSLQTRIPYSCNSWRCPVCARHEAAVTFARCKEALASKKPDGWCFLVLTLDQQGYFSGRAWPDVNAAYRELGRMTRATLSRIGRQWGAERATEARELADGSTAIRTVRKLGNAWIAVVEAHRSGWPHVNLMVWCPELASALRADYAERLEDPQIADAVALARDAWKNKEPIPPDVRELANKARLAAGPVRDLLLASCWGPQSTAEAARDAEAVVAYGVKLAGMHDQSVGELAKITQAPLAAPVRFRRFRSGKGFLPPRQFDPEVSGVLTRRRRSAEGDWELQAINAPKDESARPAIEQAARAELALIEEEEKARSRCRGKLPPMPPVRFAHDGVLMGHLETSEQNSAMRSKESALCG